VRALLGTTVLLLGLVLAEAPAGPAAAHAVLLESVPADGARLAAAPGEVVLRFDEPVRPAGVRLLDRSGHELTEPGGVSAVDTVVRLAVPTALVEGGYVVSYRVTSADGHPVIGSLVFTVGAGGAVPAAPAVATGGSLWVVAALNRAVGFAALLAAAGGALFVLLVAGPTHPLARRLRRGLLAAAAVAAVSGLAAVVLAGGELAGGPPLPALASPSTWALGFGTSLGGSVAVALVGLGTLALGLRRTPSPAATSLVALGSLVALASLGLTGHAAKAPPQALASVAVVLHALAAAFWLGSLGPLAVALRTLPGGEAAVLVRRFSGIATAAVALLVAAGAILSGLQLRAVGHALDTAYGLVWLGKVGLVLLLLVAAALNRRVLTPQLGHDGGAGTRLRWSIAAELGLMAGILALTGFLSATPPPRVLASSGETHPGHGHGDAVAPSFTATSGGSTARLMLESLAHACCRLTIELTGPDGRPLRAAEVTVELALPALKVEPLTRRLDEVAPGRHAGTVELPLPGAWTARVVARIGDFEERVFRFELPVRR
jgi:copper transport protein